ncbi:MAG: FG-GAP repeat protein [Gammaproteobacteria bacterium]|nr:FG-GAP repeat protein [Gammaproteobacteria bacterium]
MPQSNGLTRIASRFLIVMALALPILISGMPQVHAQDIGTEVQVEATMLADDGSDGDGFGAAVAIDGDLMAVAAPGADAPAGETSGTVYLYLRDAETGEWRAHQQLVPAQGHFDDNFLDMTLAIDGDTIAVGAPYADIDRFQEGAVYLFEPDTDGNWVETARLADARIDFNGHFGTGLALDGDLLAVGSPQESLDRHGRVDIFERNRGGDNQWGHVTTLYGYAGFASAVDDAGNARAFGGAVILRGDQLLVGSKDASVSFTDKRDGAVYLFRRNAGDADHWDFIDRIIAPGADQCVNGMKLSEFHLNSTAEERIEAQRCATEDIRTRNDGFGEAMAAYGDMLAIGAPTAEHGDTDDLTGVVYLFRQNPDDPDQWDFVRKLQGSHVTLGAYFGRALAMTDDTLIVGAHYESVGDLLHQGAAYVFGRDVGGPDAWGLVEKLAGSDGLSNTGFGEAVALDGKYRLVGTPGYLGRRGAVYVHEAEDVPPPQDPCSPAFASTGDLGDAGLVTHDSGVRLGATEGAVPGGLPVWVQEVPAPAEPLFANAQVHGSFYNVGAQCKTTAPPDAPFVVGLPVPEGVDPGNLGVAVLATADTVLDGPSEGRFWLPVTGSYDPGERLYMITLGALSEAGHTLALVTHPDLEPVESTIAIEARKDADGTDFLVKCVGFLSVCGAADEELVRTKLLDAYTKYRDQGFPPPALDYKTIIWIPNLGFQAITQTRTYRQIYIRPKTDPVCVEKGRVRGFYDPFVGNGTISLCVDPGSGLPPDDEVERTTYHELFHAVQWAHDNVRNNHHYARWVIEGMAETAIDSEAQMLRTPDGALRNVSARLAHDGKDSALNAMLPYEAQDFWVHLMRSTNASGVKRNFNLGALHPFLDQGATTESVARHLADPSDLAFDDLGREYWAWVKNQVAEKTDVTLDGTLQDPCKLESGLVDTQVSFSYPESEQDFGSLLPLQSELVKITFLDLENPQQGFDHIRVYAEGEDVKYKVYLAQDPAADPLLLEQDCIAIPDGGEPGRSFDYLSAQSVVYVLVSQVSYDEDRVPPFYRVAIDRETSL